MAELRQERDWLQQQLDDLWTEPPAVPTPPASIASEVRETTQEWKVLADRLESDATRIRKERGQLQDQVKKLQAANQQQTKDLVRANFTIDIFREQIEKLKQTAQPAGPTSQAPATPSGSHLPTHQEMGRHVRLPIISDPSLLLAATPDGQSVPPTLTPIRNTTPGPCGTGTPTLPRLSPQASASLAAPSRQEPDQEEDMDSEPQQGPESQQ